MDVALGPTDLPIPRDPVRLRQFVRTTLLPLAAILAFQATGLESVARADITPPGSPIHASGDREIWNRAANKVELFGNAVVRQPGESLTADYIVLDQTARTLDARGNCVYIAADTVIYGDEMHFNLDTRTGTVIGGRVSTDRFTLAGERINKLGPAHFQTHWGEYSTCRDCAQSWTFQARDVDMQIEGYAYMSDVTLKIKDSPSVWIPYLIVPMKTRRQSGFLFPTYSLSSQNGFTFVLPYFWAISRSADMTFGIGQYSKKGARFEWEGRYALSERSQGKANFFFVNDKSFVPPEGPLALNPSQKKGRWGLEAAQVQELPYGIEEKFRYLDVSDNRYPFYFEDLSQKKEAFLSSILSFSYASPDWTASLAAKRNRNLLNLESDARSFDPSTVQVYPTVNATSNDRFLLRPSWAPPVLGGISLGVSNFTRTAGAFDKNPLPGVPAQAPLPTRPDGYTPGIDPIRKATRASIAATTYTPLEPIRGFSLVPSLSYFNYFYSFHQEIDDLYRAYALVQLDLSTQIERVYELDNPNVPRRKHLIRPVLTYSIIPYIQENQEHPFIRQISYARQQGQIGYYFDNYDIVPRDLNPNQPSVAYYTPLGNSLTYGFTTQLIDRVGKLEDPTATYVTPLEFSMGQTLDFRQFQLRGSEAQPLTRLFANLVTNYNDRFNTNTTYYYYPYAPGIRSELYSSISYILEKDLHQRILVFDRSLTLSYVNARQGTYGGANGTHTAAATVNFSLSDYILPTAGVSWDFIGHQLNSYTLGLIFQSPSQCWKLTTAMSGTLTNRSIAFPTLSLNVTGSGFEGVGELTGTTPAAK